jgi:hypothetical protein
MTDPRTHHAQSTATPPASWPPGIRPISLEGLDHIGVGLDGDLYWDGKPVVVRKGVSLTGLQKAGALIVGLAAVIGACAAAVSAYADLRSIPAEVTTRIK